MMFDMPSGGSRVGAGRKKLAPENKKIQLRIYVTEKEATLLKDYLKKIRVAQ